MNRQGSLQTSSFPEVVRQKTKELAATLLKDEPFVRLFLFGSHVTGHATPRSDIDLGIELGHPVSPVVMAEIRDCFEELPIFQKVDVVDFALVDPDFRRIALEQVEVIYERSASSSHSVL